MLHNTFSLVEKLLFTRPGINFINVLRAHFLYKSASSSFFFYLHVTREKLPKRLSYEKGVRKMLMKLTSGINFTNILSLNVGLKVLFFKRIMGKMVKLTLEVNFINLYIAERYYLWLKKDVSVSPIFALKIYTIFKLRLLYLSPYFGKIS